jgi:hypothetical protein
MDRVALEASLDAALLTSDEMAAGPNVWRDYDDPFAAMFRDVESVAQAVEV